MLNFSQEDFLDNAELFGGGKVLVYLLGNITNVIVHPAFNQNDSTNDIALVKVIKINLILKYLID